MPSYLGLALNSYLYMHLYMQHSVHSCKVMITIFKEGKTFTVPDVSQAGTFTLVTVVPGDAAKKKIMFVDYLLFST